MYKPQTIICPSCSRDTKIPIVMHMVVRPPGIKCPECGYLVIRVEERYPLPVPKKESQPPWQIPYKEERYWLDPWYPFPQFKADHYLSN